MENKNELLNNKEMLNTSEKKRRTLRTLQPLLETSYLLAKPELRSEYHSRISEIYPWLYLGSLLDALDEKTHKKHGIENIISIGPLIEKRDYIKRILHIDIFDNSDAPIYDHFNEIFQFIDKVKDRKEKVLVHCSRGISRSATAVIAYHMTKSENHSLHEAKTFVSSKRPIIDPNFGFLLFLEKYEKKLKTDTSCTLCGKIINENIRTHLELRHNRIL